MLIFSNEADEDGCDVEDWHYTVEALNVKLPEKVIAIADVGLWDRRRIGYKDLRPNLNSIFDCWDSCDTIKLYIEQGNVKGTGWHHDGINHVTFRMWKPETTENLKDSVRDRLYNQYAPSEGRLLWRIKRYTRSLVPYVRKVLS